MTHFRLKTIRTVAVCAVFLIGNVAAAASEVTVTESGTGQSEASSTGSSWFDSVRLGYWGTYSGSTLSLKGYHPDKDGNRASPIGSWNQVTAGYLVSPDIQAEAQLIFDWQMSGGQQLALLNPRVGISGVFYEKGPLTIWSNINAELPTSGAAIRDGLHTSLGGFQEITYAFSGTRLSAVWGNWTRFYFYDNPTSGNSIEGSAMPFLRYRLSSTFAPQFTIEVPYRLARSENGGEFNADPLMLRPGFSWDVSERINVQPFLIIRPTREVTMDTTSFGMWLSGSIL